MTALHWAVNLLGWPALQIGLAYLAMRLPENFFARDTWLTVAHPWEGGGRIYRDYLGIRRWKGMLPDGASWLGGFAKKTLRSYDPGYLTQFLLETRRAEMAHWCMLACLPLFFLWNPPWARCVIAGYALAANLPCIAAQRYNRLVLTRALRTTRPRATLP